MNDFLTYAVPKKAVGIYIFFHTLQQFFLVVFLYAFTGLFPSLFLHTILFLYGDYTFYKNADKMLKDE
tara:strand:+ start:6246 stop:6449 length:204 start_codon:yes stop_codon:yes gene_type:complete